MLIYLVCFKYHSASLLKECNLHYQLKASYKVTPAQTVLRIVCGFTFIQLVMQKMFNSA